MSEFVQNGIVGVIIACAIAWVLARAWKNVRGTANGCGCESKGCPRMEDAQRRWAESVRRGPNV